MLYDFCREVTTFAPFITDFNCKSAENLMNNEHAFRHILFVNSSSHSYAAISKCNGINDFQNLSAIPEF